MADEPAPPPHGRFESLAFGTSLTTRILAVNLIPVTGKHARYGANGDGPDYTHGPYTLRRELLRR